MAADDIVTDVMFRVEDGAVIAVFPSSSGGAPGKVTVYSREAQHAPADYRYIIQSTKPAAPSRYGRLKRELESKPFNYKLRVVKRRARRATS